MSMEEVAPYYELILTTKNHMDRIEVKVEVVDASLLDRYRDLENLVNKIKHNLFTVLNIDAKVTLVMPGTLKRFEGKAQHVTDLRGQ